MNKGLKEVTKALRKYNNFLITSHINMEGDAVGSQLAMADILKKLGKRYVIIHNDPIPDSFKFLLNSEKIKNALGGNDRFDVIVSVDCPVVERTGRVAKYFRKAKLVVNIDHHISNSGFGDVVWVEPDMSSCGEMLYYLYRELGLKIDKTAALYMYVAILTDTGSFVYDSTSFKTHKIASELIKAGIKPLWVTNQLNEKKSVNDMRLLTETLKTLELHCDGSIAVLYTSRKMLEALGVGAERTEGFVNYARSIKTVRIAIFLIERPDKPGEVHVSFRSKGDVDVNKLATLLNGGGHPNASGCMIKGSMGHAIKVVLAKAKSFLKKVCKT
jgi:bifunctional oligoribonuclease and PAP phosphatase NrnA